jgi:hypothetical protein
MSYLHSGYDDVVIPAELASGLAALTSEQYRDTGYVKPFFRHDQDDTLYVTIQMPHRKQLGSALGDLHLHLIPMGAPGVGVTEYAYFRCNYTWQTFGGVFPALATWSADVFTQFAVVAADQYKHKIHQVLTNISAPTSEAYSSILLARITRLGATGGLSDTYKTVKPTPPGTAAANLCLLSIDAHVLCDRHGSYNATGDT